MQVNWYRNASEKDNNKAHGTGELIEIVSPHGTSESIAIIVGSEGSFVEKPLSLIKQAEVQEQVSTIELESEINQLKAKLEESDKVFDAVNKDLEAANTKVKELTEEVSKAKLSTAKKPAPKPVTPKK
jgi:septal ring factor EnvC (AmiA/AmiB activator)